MASLPVQPLNALLIPEDLHPVWVHFKKKKKKKAKPVPLWKQHARR